MLQRNITFKDYDGKTVTEGHWFNLTKLEVLRMEAKYGGSLQDYITRMIHAGNTQTLMEVFEEMIAITYGEREGAKFIKNEEVLNNFKATAAYNEFVWQLITDHDVAADFMEAVRPPDMDEEVEKIIARNPEMKAELEKAAGAASGVTYSKQPLDEGTPAPPPMPTPPTEFVLPPEHGSAPPFPPPPSS